MCLAPKEDLCGSSSWAWLRASISHALRSPHAVGTQVSSQPLSPLGLDCCGRKVGVQGRRKQHDPHLGKPWVPPGSQLVGSGLAADLQSGEP